MDCGIAHGSYLVVSALIRIERLHFLVCGTLHHQLQDLGIRWERRMDCGIAHGSYLERTGCPIFQRVRICLVPEVRSWKVTESGLTWERFSCQMPMSVWCGVLCLKSLSKWTDIQPVKNPEIITKITIFRSRYEILMWGCIGDHQGQLRLHSQEEGWVASIWFKLNFSNVEIQVSAAADNKGFVVNTRGWSCPTSPSRPPFSSPDGQPWNVEGASLRYTTKTVGLACFLTFLTTASRT